MIRKLEYILLLSFLILFSCNEGNRSNMKLASPMEEMDSSHLKKSLLHEVRKFVGKYPEINAFVLYNMQLTANKDREKENTCIGCRTVYNELYCIAEANDASFGSGEFIVTRNYPHRYLVVNDKIVFVPSNDDAFYNQKELKRIYDKIEFNEDCTPAAKHYFLLYDLVDSCKTVPNPFYDKSGSEIYDVIGDVKLPIIRFDGPVFE